MQDCIFCKIVKKEIPANLVYESDTVVAFVDIDPAADLHFVIVPKEHIANIAEASGNGEILSEIYKAADKLAEQNNLKNGFYRIVVNGGRAQHVPHLHFHLLGGNWKKQI